MKKERKKERKKEMKIKRIEICKKCHEVFI